VQAHLLFSMASPRKVIAVEQVVGAGVRVERLAPVVVHPQEAAVEHHRESVGARHRDHVHAPHGQVSDSCPESA